MPPGFDTDAADLRVLVVGNDMLIEALPALPVQLAHACEQAGFDLVVPSSWGDEMVAEAVLSHLAGAAPEPTVLCTCPLVRQRLLASGSELEGAVSAFVSPTVAVARLLRAALGSRLRLLAFAGRCPSARSPDYDQTLDPPDLMARFLSMGIDLMEQPDVYQDRLPPDRRRHFSLPGGCPRGDELWRACGSRVLVELENADLAVDLAQLLLTPQSLLIDLAPALGCSCSGVTTVTSGRQARIGVTSLEPPPAPAPVVSIPPGISLAPVAPGHAQALGGHPSEKVTAGGGQQSSGFRTASRQARRRTPLAVTPSRALGVESSPPEPE